MNGSVLSIIISIISWITPQGIVRFINSFKDRPTKTFWKKYGKQEIILVMPPADIDPLKQGTQVFDYIGIFELQDLFYKLGFKLKRVRAGTLNQTEKRGNLISIGGPLPNETTRDLLDQPEIEYKFGGEDQHTIIRKGQSVIKLEMPDKNRIEKDYGIITRMKNPYDKSKDVIIVTGIFGWGTKASIRILMDKDSLKYLNRKTRKNNYFQVICCVKIDKNQVGKQPHLLDLHPIESEKKDTFTNLSY